MIGLVAAHARASLLELMRAPGYWVPTLLFPAMLYGFFGVPASAGTAAVTTGLVAASFAVYGVLGVAFYQFGVGIAQELESPWARYVRTLPVGALPRVTARVLVALAFALATAALVLLTAALLAGLRLDAGSLLRLLAVLVAGAVPFALLGVALGYLITARAAVAVANLVYLPLAFAGGLWLPPRALPAAVAQVSPYTPTRQLGELAWSAVRDVAPPAWAVLGLAAYTAAFGALAWWAYRGDENARFG